MGDSGGEKEGEDSLGKLGTHSRVGYQSRTTEAIDWREAVAVNDKCEGEYLRAGPEGKSVDSGTRLGDKEVFSLHKSSGHI